METITVQISVGDVDYGHTLGEALKRNYPGFIVYAGQEDKNPSADVVLYDDLRRRCSQCIHLAEKTSQIDEEKGIFYKYDSAKNIAGSILSAFSRRTGRRIIYSPKSSAFLLVVHSASGGTGSTSVSLALAQELQRFRGEKTLYLSLEEYVSATDYFSQAVGKGIKEYLYYILAGQEEKCSFPDEFLCSDDYGVESLRPFIGRNPMVDLSEEEFRYFFSMIYSMGRYDAIIFDCGNNTSESAICAMKIADKLLFISDLAGRDSHYLGYMKHCLGESAVEKMTTVVNCWEDTTENLHEGEEEGNEEIVSPKHAISYDPLSFKVESERRNISLDTDFGTDVKNMLDLLRKNLT